MYRVRICAALLLATLGLAGFKQQTYDAVFTTRKADKEISERNAGMLAAITDTGVISQELYADGARYRYTFADGADYQDGNHIVYRASDADKLGYKYYISDIRQNTTDSFPLNELDGFSLEQAKSMAAEIFGIYEDINVSAEPSKVYVYDAEHINAYLDSKEELLNMHGKKDSSYRWSAQDEVYYMEYNITYNELALIADYIGDGSYYAKAHIASIAIGRDGVKYMCISGVYDKVSENVRAGERCSLDEALDILHDKFGFHIMLAKRKKIVYILRIFQLQRVLML